jgi:hypothetical protein
MSRRRRGGVPRNIDNLRASLSTKDKKKWAEKGSALHEVAALIGIISSQVFDRDEDCGSFLAELFAYLSKNQLRFVSANQVFRKTWAQWESARPSTNKGSALRQQIHEIVLNVQRRRRLARIAQHLSIPSELQPDKALLDLSDLTPMPNDSGQKAALRGPRRREANFVFHFSRRVCRISDCHLATTRVVGDIRVCAPFAPTEM